MPMRPESPSFTPRDVPIVALLVAAASLGVAARPAPRVAKVVPDPPVAFAHAGRVAVDARWLAVGAPGARHFSGAVYVHERASLDLVRVIAPPDGDLAAYLGHALALHTGTLAVGAPQHDDVGWAALVDLDGGGPSRVLVPPAQQIGERFGEALDVDALRVAVGAPGNFLFPPDDGRVVLFDRASGAPLVELPSPLPGATILSGNGFGQSVALADGRLLVGAPQTAYEGRAWLYDAASAQLLLGLEPPAAHAPRAFGSGVALGGGRAAVGDPSAHDGRGAVHVYDATSGAYAYTVEPDVDVVGGFGTHLTIDGAFLAVGAQWEHHDAGTGVVRLYDAASGALLETLTGRPLATTSRFGISLDLHDGALAVGDDEDGQAATYSGAAYLVDVGG